MQAFQFELHELENVLCSTTVNCQAKNIRACISVTFLCIWLLGYYFSFCSAGKRSKKILLTGPKYWFIFFPLNLNIDCIINRVGIVSTQASNQFHLKLWIFLPCLDAILSHLSLLLLFLIWWAYMGTVNIWKRMHFLNCQSLWK